MDDLFTLENLQRFFNTDIEELAETNEDDINYVEQNHFGDLLVEKTDENGERFKLWRNLDCNGGGVEVEYCGILNKYRWETVFNLY